jgi:hypothetical protein
MQMQYSDFLHKPMYMSVCGTITVCVMSVLPIVLHDGILLQISVLCRTDTQLLPHESHKLYFVIFQLASQPPYLYDVGVL